MTPPTVHVETIVTKWIFGTVEGGLCERNLFVVSLRRLLRAWTRRGCRPDLLVRGLVLAKEWSGIDSGGAQGGL